MSNCLICDGIIEESFCSLLSSFNGVCYNCYDKFKRRNDSFCINGVEGEVLYYYDEFFRDVLYRYKGCGDYLLKDAFLVGKIKELHNKYKQYNIVLAPSNIEKENNRNFNHLEEIFKSLKLPIIKCFVKTKNWKQSDKNLQERKQIQKIIKIDKSCLNDTKKVLIVDDVLTSGSTIKTMISQIPLVIDKKVLVLSSNCRILKNEIV